MNFAGMIFEVLLCGVWWMVALGLWIYVLLGAPDRASDLLARLLEGDASLGASFALLLLLYTVGL